MPSEPEPTLSRWRHDMKNQLGIVLGFSDLLLQELDAADPRRADIQEIHTAASRAMDLLAQLPVAGEGPPQ
jgi:hypothetical protein